LYPAFAVSQLDLPEKTETYEILRHPEGGRKGDWRGKPAAARHVLIGACQDAGFHATFWYSAALL
jgi:hypothetical protein